MNRYRENAQEAIKNTKVFPRKKHGNKPVVKTYEKVLYGHEELNSSFTRI